MSLLRKFKVFFLPREENNHKPKVLHNSSLLAIKIGLILLQVGIYFAPFTPVGDILGYAANISPDEIIRITNEKRNEVGLNALVHNATLSQAALSKGTDMLNKNYWAHVAPDGTQPWVFFVDVGYKYRYAGENLARDFSNSQAAVDAWMASTSHRENVLSDKYNEIGIGVVEGDLGGVDTTIVVQFFGTRYAEIIPQVVALGSNPNNLLEGAGASSLPTTTPLAVPSPIPNQLVSEQQAELLVATVDLEPLASPFSTTKGVSLAVVGVLLVVMVVDMLIISRKRIRRIGGRAFAHISFLGMIFALALILKAGQIL